MPVIRASAKQVELIVKLILKIEPSMKLEDRRALDSRWRRATRDAASEEIQRLNTLLGFKPGLSYPSNAQLALIAKLEREVFGTRGQRSTPADVPTYEAADDRIQSLIAIKRALLRPGGEDGDEDDGRAPGR